MSDIPSAIVADFLSRVPAESLLRFRCVSKSWRAIIDSPGFIKMHLNRTLQTNSDRKLIIRSCYLHMADFDAFENTNEADCVELDHPLKTPYYGTEVLGSCHGILCLRNTEEDVTLWNPTTRKHLKLPVSEFEFPEGSFFFTRSVVYGFGYDRLSDDYKVLRIVQSYESVSEVKVFSVKSKSWRKIGVFPYYLKYRKEHAILAGGALHWLVNRNPDSEMEILIAAFDLGTEEYRLIPQLDYPKKGFHMNVGVLGESLCLLCNYYESKRVDIWVMKNYAVKESWTKLFTVRESNVETKPFDYVIPIAYSGSGRRVFMVQNNKEPLWYDLKTRKVRPSMLDISDFSDFMEHYMCFGSLVLLDGGVSDSVGSMVDKKKAKGSQGSKKKSRKKRDDFLSQGFKLVL